MNATVTHNWHEANQHYLSTALAVVREALEHHAARAQDKAQAEEQGAVAQQALHEAARNMPAPSALETLCTTFALSPFEQDLLLLCAGIELDSRCAPLCAAAQGDPLRTYPTFSLALAALPDPHWSALTPAAPLRYWRLIEVGTGSALTLSPLRIDERTLHYLAGVQHLDERLTSLVEPVPVPSRAIALKSVSKHEGSQIGLIPARFEAFSVNSPFRRRFLSQEIECHVAQDG